MLAIRLKRTGRSGHAQFRVIVQDSRAHPKGGKVVAYVGNYDPHTKKAQLKTEEITKFLDSGAQPSDRVAKLLKKEGVKLPAWVKVSAAKKKSIRNAEKLRRNAPADKKANKEQATETSAPKAEESEQPATDEPQTKPGAETEAIEANAAEEKADEKPETVNEPVAPDEVKND